MKNLSVTTDRDALLSEAIVAVKAYNQTVNDTACAGTMETEVMQFMDGSEYGMAPLFYRSVCVDILTALADPEFGTAVKEKLGNHNYGYLLKIMSKLNDFSNAMALDNFQSQLLLNELTEHPSSYSEDVLKRTIIQYTTKLKGIITQQKISEAMKEAA